MSAFVLSCRVKRRTSAQILSATTLHTALPDKLWLHHAQVWGRLYVVVL